MITREGSRAPLPHGSHQRTLTGEYAEHVTRSWRLGEIFAGMRHHKGALLVERPRLRRCLRDRRIGGAHDHAIVPRHRKEHASIRRFRHHQSGRSRQKSLRQHHVNALAHRHQRLDLRLIEPTQFIDENTRGVDHHLCPHRELAGRGARPAASRVGFVIAYLGSHDAPSGVFNEAGARTIVNHHRAPFCCRLRE